MSDQPTGYTVALGVVPDVVSGDYCEFNIIANADDGRPIGPIQLGDTSTDVRTDDPDCAKKAQDATEQMLPEYGYRVVGPWRAVPARESAARGPLLYADVEPIDATDDAEDGGGPVWMLNDPPAGAEQPTKVAADPGMMPVTARKLVVTAFGNTVEEIEADAAAQARVFFGDGVEFRFVGHWSATPCHSRDQKFKAELTMVSDVY